MRDIHNIDMEARPGGFDSERAGASAQVYDTSACCKAQTLQQCLLLCWIGPLIAIIGCHLSYILKIYADLLSVVIVPSWKCRHAVTGPFLEIPDLEKRSGPGP